MKWNAIRGVDREGLMGLKRQKAARAPDVKAQGVVFLNLVDRLVMAAM